MKATAKACKQIPNSEVTTCKKRSQQVSLTNNLKSQTTISSNQVGCTTLKAIFSNHCQSTDALCQSLPKILQISSHYIKWSILFFCLGFSAFTGSSRRYQLQTGRINLLDNPCFPKWWGGFLSRSGLTLRNDVVTSIASNPPEQ